MIDFPVPEALDKLRAFREPYCVSMYVPMPDPAAGTSDESRIDLKHLIREAKLALHEAGMSKHRIRKTLHRAEELLELDEFWPPRHESMALFMHEDFFRYYHIADHDIPFQVTVGRGFNLLPLLAAMSANRSYFVLALGHKNVRLYEGDRYDIRLVQIKGFPAHMHETLRIDELPKWRQTHSIRPTAQGKGSRAYHGQYNVAQVDKAELEEFFRQIDQRLHFYLMAQHKPLILAGTRYLLPIYRKVNTYPYLWPQSISGNLEHIPLSTIKRKAWSLITHSTRHVIPVSFA